MKKKKCTWQYCAIKILKKSVNNFLIDVEKMLNVEHASHPGTERRDPDPVSHVVPSRVTAVDDGNEIANGIQENRLYYIV